MKLYKVLREYLILLVIAFVLAQGVRTVVAQSYVIPTGSMIPTIKRGDYILADKVTYRFREPRRGEIVVFNPPEEISRIPFVKRVIGLSGDAIKVTRGQVYVNGRKFVVDSAPRAMYEYGPVTVPDGAMFVLGDNRNQSFDSHNWGFVPIDQVIGKGLFVYWPAWDIKLLQ
jgi:signal peptidase I